MASLGAAAQCQESMAKPRCHPAESTFLSRQWRQDCCKPVISAQPLPSRRRQGRIQISSSVAPKKSSTCPPSATSETMAASVAVHQSTSAVSTSSGTQQTHTGFSATASTQTKRCPFTGALSAVATVEDFQQEVDERQESQRKTRKIPGPEPWDLLENVRDLSVIATKGIEEATLFYGNKYGPICRFSNGLTAWTFVNDADIIQHICSTNTKNYSLRFLPAIYEHVTHGRGILGSQGEYNRVHRKMCQPPFMKPALLAKFSDTISGELQGLVDVWRAAAQGKVGWIEGDMALHIQRFTLNLIGLVAFSKDFGQLQRIKEDPTGKEASADAGSDRLLLAVNESQQLMANVFITPLPVLRLLHWAREPGMVRLEGALQAMQDVMMDVIQERRDTLASTGEAGDDLLGVLLQAKDETGFGLTNEELWEDVHDVMGAGHETTATTMTASLFLISQHPHVLAKVQQEMETNLQGRAPTFEDVSSGRLPYTLMAVKETLRMYPPIPLFPRQVAEDDWLPGGYHVPKGDVVFMSTYAMGRNPKYWPDPLQFRPERFMPELEATRSKFAWVPFGAGPRMCLGANFAVLAVTQVVATLLQNFSFEAVRPEGQSLPYAYDITMNFPGGVHMRIKPR